MFDMEKMSALITEQGAAFEAFKAAHAEEIKKADAVTAEKLAKIETSLDTAVEAKAALEAKLARSAKPWSCASPACRGSADRRPTISSTSS
jgi:hypothetical protein